MQAEGNMGNSQGELPPYEFFVRPLHGSRTTNRIHRFSSDLSPRIGNHPRSTCVETPLLTTVFLSLTIPPIPVHTTATLAFRALRATGLALGLGITALAAYQHSRQGQMASRSSHLDATQGREVVYCHACEHEWYKDDRPDTLSCPACHGDITEIISPGNDPRNIDDDNESLPDFLRHHRHHDIDSDPEEEDIEQHIERGPGGFFGQSTIHHAPRPPGYGARPRAQPDDSDAIMNRFSEMLGGMGAGMRGPPGMVGRSGPETLFRHGPESPNVTYQTFTGPGYTGGVSSFTITTGSGPGRVHHARGLGAPGGPDAGFQSIFSDILGGIGPPPMHHEGQPQPPGQGGNADRRSGDLANALNQLFATLINPNAVHGDAVYSQEALDRIITNLMEANPSSNAPAPASEAAITKLPRKKLDEQMLGPELKGECTICIDDMSVGDEVVVLPCNHWFHEECVTLWLKEHNSCPICRAPIDEMRHSCEVIEFHGFPGGSERMAYA
ncbi:Uu.00g050020.m01.CDS01 [Anthostomella pinea]|uniref:RING-type E3 ubiquitin transferase n=1 Tax=Anthostomella pinea TaxID=933095 RepID=A0AAI8VBX4_9PEZI|nr:Uu.00g050020.m01.CDS01 [Anthostomella pinea]